VSILYDLYVPTSVRPYRILLSTRTQTLKRETGVSGTDSQVVSFFGICSILLKQHMTDLNISLQMFVHWVISYTTCSLSLATLETELFLAQHIYKKLLTKHIF